MNHELVTQSKMVDRAGWQKYLETILRTETVLNALAAELIFHKESLKRWGRGTIPREPKHTLRSLVYAKAFPQEHRAPFIEEVRKVYPDFDTEPVSLFDERPAKEIPPLFYSQILRSVVYVAEPLITWTVTNTIFHQLFSHLDADGSAQISTLLLLCTPPQQGNDRVRSLYTPLRQTGERPLLTHLTFPVLLGNESMLTDVRPSYDRPLILTEQDIQTSSLPFPGVRSVAVLPIQRRGKIAGSVVLSSSIPGYFENTARQHIVHEYCGLLLSFAFHDADFHDPGCCAFANFPHLASQQAEEAKHPFQHTVFQLRSRYRTATREELEMEALRLLEQRLATVQEQETTT